MMPRWSSSRPSRGSGWRPAGRAGPEPGFRRRQGRGRTAADQVFADGCLLDGLACGYEVLGFGRAGDGRAKVFRDLVLALIIEPLCPPCRGQIRASAGIPN
jgi:hypothetical protein